MVIQQSLQLPGRLDNKYMARVKDTDVLPDGRVYYVTDHLPGESLTSLLRRAGRLSVWRTLGIGARMLKGLRAVHREGLVHGAIRTDHVWIVRCQNGESVRLEGLGFPPDLRPCPRGPGHQGSPLQYLSPEQLAGGAASVRGDIYSVGVLLYHCITGQYPFDGRTANALLTDMRSRKPVAPELLRRDLEEYRGLSSVILRALSLDPASRYPSAGAFFRDVALIARGEYPVPASPDPVRAMARTGRHRRGKRGTLGRRGALMRYRVRRVGTTLALVAAQIGLLFCLWPIVAPGLDAIVRGLFSPAVRITADREQLPGAPVPPRRTIASPRTVFDLAMERLRSGDFPRARQLLEQARAMGVDSSMVLLPLAEATFLEDPRGNRERAIALLETSPVELEDRRISHVRGLISLRPDCADDYIGRRVHGAVEDGYGDDPVVKHFAVRIASAGTGARTGER